MNAFCARRLVRTESAYVANAAQSRAYDEAGIERYRFVATLDSRTCECCAALDGKVFELANAKPGTNYPPMHPFCRSTTIADFGEEELAGLERRARDKDGNTVRVPADMTYENWHREFVEGEKTLDKSGGSGIIEMTRRKSGAHRRTNARNLQIIDKPTYNKLTSDFLKHDGIIIRGEEAAKHLGDTHSASYLPSLNTAFIRDDATISEVLEEMYHAEQDRKNMFGDTLTTEVWLRREIDAQKHLLSLSEKYKIPQEEIEVTKGNLEQYEAELKKLLGGE